MKKINKILMGMGMSICLATTGLAMTGCGKNSDKAHMSVNDVFAMGMVSASNYLDNNSTGGRSGMTLGAKVVAESSKNTIKEYTQMFEGLLNDGIHPTKSANDNLNEDFQMYANKLTLTLGDIEYIMYYNEVAEGSKTELDEDEIESETTSFLSGKVVALGSTYYVVGIREIENETKKDIVEIEDELKMVFSSEELNVGSSVDFDALEKNLPTNCVVIEQEAENQEFEFKYTTKTGTSTKTVEIEFENVDGHEELEIEIEEGDSKTEYTIFKEGNRYAVKLKENGNKAILYLEKDSDGVWNFVTE